ncbi:hypothetical protein ACIPVB_06810 [Microbacterium sp. NPDC090007]|uniref:hypothetical protein n=1 Tax=Microbacterium sp. NPDC090007 TaxID=3364204 RepID=UPI00381AA495
MSTPTPLPGPPAEPSAPTPSEPTAPTPAEPTVPLTPETQSGPASTHDDGAGAFARDEGDAVGSAEMDADNAVE